MNNKEAVDRIEVPDNKFACPKCGNTYIMKVHHKDQTIVRKVIIWIFYLAIETIPNKESKAFADRYECTCLKCGHKWKT